MKITRYDAMINGYLSLKNYTKHLAVYRCSENTKIKT